MVIETLTYGGTINSGSHGTGKTQVIIYTIANDASDYTGWYVVVIVNSFRHPLYPIPSHSYGRV